MPRDALPAADTGWRASLALDFERRGERTVLAGKRHEGPLVVQKALHPEGPGVCHAIVVHPPAGIAGGDALTIDVHARDAAHALITTPGAGKWYRSAGAEATQRTHLRIGAGAGLEWLPQETILYEGARARLAFHAELASDARLLAWDIACLGRTGSGEGFARGEARWETRIVRAGRPVFVERARIAPGHPAAHSPAGLDGRPVFGTLLFAAQAADAGALAACREITPPRGEGAVTLLPGILVARYRGDAAGPAREWFAGLWSCLRMAAFGVTAVEPRIWRT